MHQILYRAISELGCFSSGV